MLNVHLSHAFHIVSDISTLSPIQYHHNSNLASCSLPSSAMAPPPPQSDPFLVLRAGWTPSYLRRWKRRSTSSRTADRSGRNGAATARVEAATNTGTRGCAWLDMCSPLTTAAGEPGRRASGERYDAVDTEGATIRRCSPSCHIVQFAWGLHAGKPHQAPKPRVRLRITYSGSTYC